MSPIIFVGIISVLIMCRLLLLKPTITPPKVYLTPVILCFVGLFFINQLAAIKFYPVLVSVGLGGVFLISLIKPPTVIERLARMQEPNLNEAGVRYTRNVTIIWTGFFVLNALISVYTVFFSSLEIWTLYNGFISYLLIGLLFCGEFIIRRYAKKKHTKSS
ncbi:COG4648 family protein [Curvivirga aplysinae]|uniref:COG4648 family protein n=1 Tax=Curvivirga aplysinae TaxID=2529852 RepID=UPI001C3F8200|nr:hypothetical protein [Curvivirga aplysinae]